jgi:hypothetical protein
MPVAGVDTWVDRYGGGDDFREGIDVTPVGRVRTPFRDN